ncbi:unnamed protein product [Dracunculus medinensis]|uniref:Negative elongation factor E n=1 Tax=Dracunculus medinensis TaxID=318479 RepID=A0A0N4U664_DRAME|nr:unnamed protein product [Dracunculus medinensis]
MKETAIVLPTSLTEEEKALKVMFEKLRAIRKALLVATGVHKSVANDTAKIERKTAKRSLQEAEEATEEVKRKVMSGAINLAKLDEKITFKRSKIEKRRDSGKLKSDADSTHINETPAVDGFDTYNSSGDGFDNYTAGDDGFDNYNSGSLDNHASTKPVPCNMENRGPTLYIRGYDLVADTLKKAFSEFGNVMWVNVEECQRTAFVTLGSAEEAEKAIEEMDGYMVNGITLRVSFARRQNQRGPMKRDGGRQQYANHNKQQETVDLANLYGSTPSELYGSTSADSLYSTPADSKEDDGFATYQPFEMNASANDGSDAQDSQNEVDIANDGFDTYTPFGNEDVDKSHDTKTYEENSFDNYKPSNESNDDGFDNYQATKNDGDSGFDNYQTSQSQTDQNQNQSVSHQSRDDDGVRGPALYLRGRDLDENSLRILFEKFGRIVKMRVEEHKSYVVSCF